MKMNSRSSRWFLLGLCLVFLSGCVYIRLLKVKRQLANFDAHFSISGEKQLVLHLKKPVLLDKDLSYLIGAEPFSIQKMDRGDVWFYRFRMVRDGQVPPAPLEDLSLTLFMQEGKLKEMIVPEKFLRCFNRNVLEQAMRQAAHADVKQFKKLVKGDVKLSPELLDQLPDRTTVERLLGPPLQQWMEASLLTYQYRYSILKDPNDVPIIAKLTFLKDGRLSNIHIKWDTASVDITFPRQSY